MSSRQQVLFLLEQTMKEADWNVENQNGEDSIETKQIIIRNENEVFEAMRKKQVRSRLLIPRGEKSWRSNLRDTEALLTPFISSIQ